MLSKYINLNPKPTTSFTLFYSQFGPVFEVRYVYCISLLFNIIVVVVLRVSARLLYPIRVAQSAVQVYICQKYICYIC